MTNQNELKRLRVESQIKWLESFTSTISSLKRVREKAEQLLQSDIENETLVFYLENAERCIDLLLERLNSAAVYERELKIETFLLESSEYCAVVKEGISELVRHHYTHMRFIDNIKACETLESRILNSADTPERERDLLEIREAKQNANHHLSICSDRLIDTIQQYENTMKSLKQTLNDARSLVGASISRRALR